MIASLTLMACGAPADMVLVYGGPFYMGQPAADPQHPGRDPELTWTSAFYLDRHEVTQRAYADFVQATGYKPPFVDEPWATELGLAWVDGRPPEALLDHPVVLVSWYDAREYCRWKGRRLPTEAEWERAAYGTDGRAWPWGSTWRTDAANHGMLGGESWDPSDGYQLTSPVGAFPDGVSPYGAYDLFGNAWEWTADHPAASWAETRDGWLPGLHWRPEGPAEGLYRSVRGGSYYFELEDDPWRERNSFLPEIRRKTSGFRCAVDG